MPDKLIPDNALLAAKRGFIRTTAQAYGTALAGGITATVVLGVVTGEIAFIPTLVTGGVTLVSPLIAGAASFFSLLAGGIPGDYAADTNA